MTDAARPHLDNLTFNFKGRDQKVSALSFHVTLSQMRPLAVVAKTSALPLLALGDVPFVPASRDTPCHWRKAACSHCAKRRVPLSGEAYC